MVARARVWRASHGRLATWIALLAGCSSRPAPLPAAALQKDAGLASLGSPETQCLSCHPGHVADWAMSSHAYGMKDPVFQAMTRVAQAETNGKVGDFCVKCHAPFGPLTGVTNVFQNDAGVFEQRISGLAPSVMSGVSCLVCHSISDVPQTYNAGFTMHVDHVRHGPITDPEPTTAHDSVYSNLHTQSKFCGSCHEVINDKNVAVERTHIEWVQSVFPGQKDCQTCHMPTHDGPAAVGHRTRKVHSHTFVGADVSLLPPEQFPGYDALREDSDALLKSALTFTLAPNLGARSLDIAIENLAGHALPSGATSDRQMWVELIVKDASDRVVFESGTLDENGDLRVDNPDRTTRPGTDPNLVFYREELTFDPHKVDGGSSLAHPVDFLWEPNALKEYLIGASETDHRSYPLASLGPGHYSARARVLFRSFPPYLLRKLEQIGGLDPSVKGRVPTVEMATATAEFDLP